MRHHRLRRAGEPAHALSARRALMAATVLSCLGSASFAQDEPTPATAQGDGNAQVRTVEPDSVDDAASGAQQDAGNAQVEIVDTDANGSPEAEEASATAAVSRGACDVLPSHAELTETLSGVVAAGDPTVNGGLGNHMWAAVVDRSGRTCAVTHSGESFGDQWPGSRAIAIVKAFGANAFSLPNFALSTANLYWPSQPGNSLFGLPVDNPFSEEPILSGDAENWGSENDPAVGERIGGTVVFGGGLPLYTPEGELVGALGLSGDQSCTDHVIAWRVRHRLNLDNVPKGVTDEDNDNIIYDLATNPATGEKESASGYGHPACGSTATRIAEEFARTAPTGPEE